MNDDERAEKLREILEKFGGKPQYETFTEKTIADLVEANKDMLGRHRHVRNQANVCNNPVCNKRDSVIVANIFKKDAKGVEGHLGIVAVNEHGQDTAVAFLDYETAKLLVNELMMAIAEGEKADGIQIDPLYRADC